MKRHIVRVHGGVEEPEPEEVVSTDLSQETLNVDLNPVSEITPELDLATILTELKLEHLLNNFVSEGVNLEMLVFMNSTDLKECLKEVNVKRFGDRFKICERLRTVTGIISSEHHTVETENNLEDPVITEAEYQVIELCLGILPYY